MNNLSIQHILADGLVLSLLLGGLIFLSLYINPRLWLQDYPASIREKVTPLTPAEKQMRGVFMLLFLAAVFVPLYLSGAGIEARQGDGVSFWAVFTHVFLVFNIFNLFDALVIDYLVLALMRPKALLIPEALTADGMLDAALMDWRLHVGNYLKGIIFCAALAALVALLVTAL